MGSSTGERNDTKIIWGARGKTGVWHIGRGDAATSSPVERNNRHKKGNGAIGKAQV